jgi:uncharacterized protein Smg (DUF494 family)
MERHIIEILVLIIKAHPEGLISIHEFSALNESLDEMGYSQQEIDMALFWYHNHLMTKDDIKSDKFEPGSIRVLHEIERSIIRPEAYGYLLELNQLGLINVSEMDSIIDKSVLLGGRKVSIEDIKLFVAAHIMDQDSGFGSSGISQYMRIPTSKIQ